MAAGTAAGLQTQGKGAAPHPQAAGALPGRATEGRVLHRTVWVSRDLSKVRLDFEPCCIHVPAQCPEKERCVFWLLLLLFKPTGRRLVTELLPWSDAAVPGHAKLCRGTGQNDITCQGQRDARGRDKNLPSGSIKGSQVTPPWYTNTERWKQQVHRTFIR